MVMGKSKLTAVTIDGKRYVLLQHVCETLNINYPRARRFARKNDGTIPGARHVFGKWVVPDGTTFVLPEPKRFGAKPRDDGRQRYIVYMSPAEHTKMVADAKQRGDDYIGLIIDPRVRAKQRRIDKRAITNALDAINKNIAAVNDAKQ